MAKHNGGPQLGQSSLHPGQLLFQHLQAGHILLEAGKRNGVESLLLPSSVSSSVTQSRANEAIFGGEGRFGCVVPREMPQGSSLPFSPLTSVSSPKPPERPKHPTNPQAMGMRCALPGHEPSPKFQFQEESWLMITYLTWVKAAAADTCCVLLRGQVNYSLAIGFIHLHNLPWLPKPFPDTPALTRCEPKACSNGVNWSEVGTGCSNLYWLLQSILVFLHLFHQLSLAAQIPTIRRA